MADEGVPKPASVSTHRVVSGSLWGVGGQGVTLLASLVAMPFVLRLLGAERYGVLALLNVIVGYVAVADLGMGLASTRFGAQAHERGCDDEEVAVIWTSIAVLAVPVVGLASLLAAGATVLVERFLGLAGPVQEETVLALRLAALGFIVRALAGVLNTPQMVRLRLDLVTLVTSGGAVLQIVAVPLSLWLLGGGLITAALVSLVVWLGIAAAQLGIAVRILPSVAHPRFRWILLRPLVRFGWSNALIVVIGLVLFNAEKFLVAGLASPVVLAYYAVAFTLARLLAVLPAALTQSLLPAFSRLEVEADREPLRRLYIRALRVLVLGSFPLAAIIVLIATPFLTVWAGDDYARESALPLYILTAGCLVDALSYVPRTLLQAIGRPGLIARYQMITLVPYLTGATVLVSGYAAVGAAIAWTGRATVECVLMFAAAVRHAGVSPRPFDGAAMPCSVALGALAAPLVVVSWADPPAQVSAAIGAMSVLVYLALAWGLILSRDERAWMVQYCMRMAGATGR